ncbi:MAG: cytochrome b N-terminal domain-containing protein [Chloroflexi bacterium]|nr:cytochrome b N-terminal domain-containing protein [Chloroflexota bacterium]
MSLFIRLWNEFDDRAGFSGTLLPVIRHPVPPRLGWEYVLGSATLISFTIQVLTGIALALMYVPSAAEAYNSLQFITNNAAFGSVLRGIHFFSASAMILFVGAHAIRTFLTGAFKYPRELNWISGTVLLLLTVTMGFTGQLLRWDQTAVWTAIVAAEQAGRIPLIGKSLAYFLLGGENVGGATLSRFYAFHVFFVPALIFALLGLHLFLVIYHGISEPAKPGKPVSPKTYRTEYSQMLKDRGVPFWPDAAWKDAIFSTLATIVVVVLAIIVGAPALSLPPNPSIVGAVPRPDWYLLWVFALFALMPPAIENVAIFLLPLLGIGIFVLTPFFSNKGERSPLRRPWAVGIVIIIVVMVASMTIAGAQAPWSPDFAAKPLPVSIIGTSSGPVYQGAQLFYEKGCEYCHMISGQGGSRGPNLTTVGTRLTKNDIIIRIVNGGVNMPAFGGSLTSQELSDLVAFLQSRK